MGWFFLFVCFLLFVFFGGGCFVGFCFVFFLEGEGRRECLGGFLCFKFPFSEFLLRFIFGQGC